MSVIQFPVEGIYTKDGTNVFQEMLKYFDELEKTGRISADERRNLANGLYSCKALIERNAGEQVKEWIKSKARQAYRDFEEFRVFLPEDSDPQFGSDQ